MSNTQQPTPATEKTQEEPMIWLLKPSGPLPTAADAKAEAKKPAEPKSK